MPIEIGIWRIDDKPQKVSFSSLTSEAKLEEVLNKDISVLSSALMLIGRQVQTAHGKYIDLLAMDAEGNLSVIELKRHRTPREVVAQLLDYGSWVQNLSYDEIVNIYSDNNKDTPFEQGFAEAFDSNPPDKLNEQLQLIVVAAELDNASERIINFLADNYGVPINAMFFRYFKDGDHEYLTRSWLIDPQEAEVKTSKTKPQKGKETWNGQDFYIAYGDMDNGNLDWEDARKYGFVAADGGRWYTRTLEQLFLGARIFVCIPKTGYVAVGKVIETVQAANDFMVDVNGTPTSILEAPLNGHYHKLYADNPEKCAYFVRVEWQYTVPKQEAYWEKGMYANQNTVTKLRNRFTLERLIQHFGVESSD